MSGILSEQVPFAFGKHALVSSSWPGPCIINAPDTSHDVRISWLHCGCATGNGPGYSAVLDSTCELNCAYLFADIHGLPGYGVVRCSTDMLR